MANACGPCIGQWNRSDVSKDQANSILTSYNRNFPKRNDGSPNTHAFITSPELVMAMAFEGRLTFDPLHEEVSTDEGKHFKLAPPVAEELPVKGYDELGYGLTAPAADGSAQTVSVDPSSKRLQLLTPFAPFDGKDFEALPILVKAKGKCTTDHISPAGPWLRFRGHLENISDNAFSGAINAFTGEAGHGKNQVSGETGKPYHEVAKAYKSKGLKWVAVGDENYGEGSSREHAAMSPRFLNCAAVITRSFARIHETNLKKQGILPLTFANPADYDLIAEDDRISIQGLKDLAPGKAVSVLITKPDGQSQKISCNHSLTIDQISWFRAGGALNQIRAGAA